MSAETPRIRVLDTETSGLEPTDKVCEIGWTDLTKTDAGWIIGPTSSTLCRVEVMPPQARAIHHISAEETHGFPAFDPDALWLKAAAEGVDVVAAHNIAFDMAHLVEARLPTICTLKAARHLWPEAPGHSNGVLRYWLQDQGRINPEDARCHPAHRAGPDTYVTAHVLRHMLDLVSAAQLVAWTKLPLVFHVWTFGKHRGLALTETPGDYLDWVVTKSELDDDVKWNCRRELDRRRQGLAN